MTKYGNYTQATLKSKKLAPNKRFGQNFLVNKHTAEAIVNAGAVTDQDDIIEVGVGLGALTIPLAAAAKHVFGFEIDSGIIRFHEEEDDLPKNVTLIHQDILTADFQDLSLRCGGALKILANLPYSISNPFIFKLIDNAAYLDTATIMLQKEVAERLMAKPGTKEYGVPTVLLASCASLRKVMTLKPAEFHPRPKIDSVVVTIDFKTVRSKKSSEGTPGYDFPLFKKIVKTTFNQRRKTILNTLSEGIVMAASANNDKIGNKRLIEDAIHQAGLSPSDRPETLSFADFVLLTSHINDIINRSTGDNCYLL